MGLSRKFFQKTAFIGIGTGLLGGGIMEAITWGGSSNPETLTLGIAHAVTFGIALTIGVIAWVINKYGKDAARPLALIGAALAVATAILSAVAPALVAISFLTIPFAPVILAAFVATVFL